MQSWEQPLPRGLWPCAQGGNRSRVPPAMTGSRPQSTGWQSFHRDPVKAGLVVVPRKHVCGGALPWKPPEICQVGQCAGRFPSWRRRLPTGWCPLRELLTRTEASVSLQCPLLVELDMVPAGRGALLFDPKQGSAAGSHSER